MGKGRESEKIKKYVSGILASPKLLYPQSIEVLNDIKNFIDFQFKVEEPEKQPAPPSLRDWLADDEKQEELEIKSRELGLKGLWSSFLDHAELGKMKVLKDKLVQHRIVEADIQRFRDEFGINYSDTRVQFNDTDWEREIDYVIGFHVD